MNVGMEIRVLGHPVALKIVDFLTKHSAYPGQELSDALSLPLEVVTFQLLSLEAQGLVKGELEEAPDNSGVGCASIEVKVVKRYCVTSKLAEVVKQLEKITSVSS